MRHFSLIDKILAQVDNAFTTIFTASTDARDNPANHIAEIPLTPAEQRNSVGCMRVNHTGEVCEQALYRGQLIFCRTQKTRAMLEKSCNEETNHLAWTKVRVQELGGRTSVLNLFFYGNSFLIGVLAGMLGDSWSLGFVEETEIQVAKHLDGHLHRLSEKDQKSRAIVTQMRDEEKSHEKAAVNAGARELPTFVKKFMRCHAVVMTRLVYFL